MWSTVHRTWPLRARTGPSKYRLPTDRPARYGKAHGCSAGPFQNFAGADAHTSVTDERRISATPPDGVLPTPEPDTPEPDTPGVSLRATRDGVRYAGTEASGKDPARPGRRPDTHPYHPGPPSPPAEDPYRPHRP
ncbi:hypothetical protein ACIHEI_26550 [Kitasatospora sp. NPDC051984]|uniref:hypothetical protein n=1 Tax=Kitasatospora sp. NPDC051984 TaxID=3364059 RepID=UPI0037CB3035